MASSCRPCFTISTPCTTLQHANGQTIFTHLPCFTISTPCTNTATHHHYTPSLLHHLHSLHKHCNTLHYTPSLLHHLHSLCSTATHYITHLPCFTTSTPCAALQHTTLHTFPASPSPLPVQHCNTLHYTPSLLHHLHFLCSTATHYITHLPCFTISTPCAALQHTTLHTFPASPSPLPVQHCNTLHYTPSLLHHLHSLCSTATHYITHLPCFTISTPCAALQHTTLHTFPASPSPLPVQHCNTLHYTPSLLHHLHSLCSTATHYITHLPCFTISTPCAALQHTTLHTFPASPSPLPVQHCNTLHYTPSLLHHLHSLCSTATHYITHLPCFTISTPCAALQHTTLHTFPASPPPLPVQHCNTLHYTPSLLHHLHSLCSTATHYITHLPCFTTSTPCMTQD